MAIGPILREARQKKQLTASQVAEMTRMKVQIVDDLENDDFHRIAATIYGKGFIKLFAECVDLDPAPLLDDYLQQVGTPLPPQLPTSAADASPTAEEQQAPFSPPDTTPDPEPEPVPVDDLFSYADHTRRHPKPKPAPPSTIPSSPKRNLTQEIRQYLDKAEIPTAFKTYYERLRAGLARAVETMIQWVTESGENEKWIQRGLLALGLIVLILILIPLARTLMTSRTPAPVPNDELILFVPPPEPYLD